MGCVCRIFIFLNFIWGIFSREYIETKEVYLEVPICNYGSKLNMLLLEL